MLRSSQIFHLMGTCASLGKSCRHDEDMDKALRQVHQELDHERALRMKAEAEAQSNGALFGPPKGAPKTL